MVGNKEIPIEFHTATKDWLIDHAITRAESAYIYRKFGESDGAKDDIGIIIVKIRPRLWRDKTAVDKILLPDLPDGLVYMPQDTSE